MIIYSKQDNISDNAINIPKKSVNWNQTVYTEKKRNNSGNYIFDNNKI